ncbi:MAG: hypothetical protein EZS28_055794, partial [Streblomastix strix]
KIPFVNLVGNGADGLNISWPGDIVCTPSHIGIISGPQKTISASSKPDDWFEVVENNWGWRPGDQNTVRVYRYHP